MMNVMTGHLSCAFLCANKRQSMNEEKMLSICSLCATQGRVAGA